MDGEHICDDRCTCPRCGKAMYYAKSTGEHACVDTRCAFLMSPGQFAEQVMRQFDAAPYRIARAEMAASGELTDGRLRMKLPERWRASR